MDGKRRHGSIEMPIRKWDLFRNGVDRGRKMGRALPTHAEDT